ncbi:MAG: VWA domain-containing protein [Acidobacteria bacterium]|nr:VWA domain-containing protein [Acidobacteriota bacterium]
MIARNQVFLWMISASLLIFTPSLPCQEKQATPPIFRVEVETVYVKVSISDPLGRYVTGLEKENFKIYEDNIEQTILHFSMPAAPISVGIVFDISGSMGYGRNIRIGKSWLANLLRSIFIEARHPEDEFSLITFNNKVNLVKAFTDKSNEVENALSPTKPGGSTALYDAVYRALDHIKEGKNDKKAIVLITDGEENSSRYKWSEVREFCKESDVQIYGIGMPGPEQYGHSTISHLVGLTGGRAFSGEWGDLSYYFDLINAELRSQYLLSYVPSNTLHDGKWRRIRVKLDVPAGLPKLTIRAREGYYASGD